MKDSLIDRPPTIGDLRRQGVETVEVRCRLPCRRIGRVEFAKLKLSDETIFSHISRLRRLKCTQCDRVVAEVAPIFPPQEPPRIGEQRPAQWILVTREADGAEARSSPLWSREEALGFARRQVEQGSEVVRIEGPAGDVEADEIVSLLADRY